MLGARVPIDIKPDATGAVARDTGGMSVTPNDPAKLPPHLRPTSLPGGQTTLPVFWISSRNLGEMLAFQAAKKRPDRHGFIEPAVAMQLDTYQTALCGTVLAWQEWTEEVA
jgi:hypothetical protein